MWMIKPSIYPLGPATSPGPCQLFCCGSRGLGIVLVRCCHWQWLWKRMLAPGGSLGEGVPSGARSQDSILTLEWQAGLEDVGSHPRTGAAQVEAWGCWVEAAWNAESSVLALNADTALSQRLLEWPRRSKPALDPWPWPQLIMLPPLRDPRASLPFPAPCHPPPLLLGFPFSQLFFFLFEVCAQCKEIPHEKVTMNHSIVTQSTIKADVQHANMKQEVGFTHTCKTSRCAGAGCFVLLSKDGKHWLLLNNRGRCVCLDPETRVWSWQSIQWVQISKKKKEKRKKASAHRDSYTRLTFQNQTGFRLSGSNYLKHQLIENVLPKQLVWIHDGGEKSIYGNSIREFLWVWFTRVSRVQFTLYFTSCKIYKYMLKMDLFHFYILFYIH